MKKRALITGITGFAGSHLAELLLSENVEVYGIQRWRSKSDNIDHIKNKIQFHEADLLDAHSLYKVIEEVAPNFIFHLAAQSYVQSSWASPANTLEVNITGSVHLFEAVRKSGLDCPIQIACSSEEYGKVLPNELPIKEENPLRPLSPYAVSKIAMDYLGYQYNESYQTKIIRTRGFNHTGPRRGDVFAESTFAKQIAEIEKGLAEPIVKVGNIDAVRDFTDVRDMVKAYYLAVQKCDPGEVYNISTGKGRKIKYVLDLLLSMSKVKITVKKDPERMRPSDVPVLIGDATKFVKKTGWKPEIPFEKTMEDLLNYWRERVR
ncbi:GDP-mannose 4,6-dehydratase [Candidatus Gottesmanbacteria bacterium]|nr:GDP-mannose 4,6-dehydratase [Candidatus Gottesmanbacteria bacterium]